MPAADLEVAFYLHGIDRQPDSVSIIWRADIARLQDDNVRRLLLLVPPRSTEAVELPVWAVQRWLRKLGKPLSDLADVPSIERPQNLTRDDQAVPLVFRWRGDDPESKWISPEGMRPGDTLIVPAASGGLDEFGWNPESKHAVEDVADKASSKFAGNYFAVRLAPGLLGNDVKPDELAEALADSVSEHWHDFRISIEALALPLEVRQALKDLDRARKKRVRVYT